MTTHRCPSIRPLHLGVPFGLLFAAVAAAVTTVCILPARAWAADETNLQRLATCQDSWNDWQEGDPRMQQYQGFIRTRLVEADEASFTPKGPMSAFGLPITRVFPQSVGMGVGFSILVGRDLAEVRRTFEAQVGRSLTCATSDGSPACELKVGAKKTVVLMTEGPRSGTTLAGCYYFYQQ